MQAPLKPATNQFAPAPYASIGIIAWNEQDAIGATVRSLFLQTLFGELAARNLHCEVICVANGCTDSTTSVAADAFALGASNHRFASCIRTRVVDLREQGKVNAWNQYVHELSATESRFLFMMDADILIHRPETLWNMLQTLEGDPDASVAVDRPCKHLEFRSRRTVWDRLSLAAAKMTTSAEGQLCGQLYCIRTEVARRIFLPKDLSACEDGLIKALVCTDLLSGPVRAQRIRLAPAAEHTFEAYTSPGAILRNQKRQVIGQTMIHVLVDQHLTRLPLAERINLADTIRKREADDPAWLKRLIGDHVRNTRHFWKLYPGLVGHRFKRLRDLPPLRKAACFPAATAATCATLAASYLAYRSLKSGSLQYWPKAKRSGFAEGQMPAQPVPAHSNHP